MLLTLIAPWIARHDAFGAIARDTFVALAGTPGITVTALASRIELPEIHGESVKGVADLLLHPAFLAADMLMYQFPIHHPFFNAVLVGNGHAKQIVRFHNVTPRAFMAPEAHALVRRSFEQIQNFRWADEVWADSSENADELERQGIPRDMVHVLPPAVEQPGFSSYLSKVKSPIRLVYVGRFTPAKGVLELIEAVDLARRTCACPFELRLIGNVGLSRADYVSEVRNLIAQKKLEGVVEIVGTADEAALAGHYHAAHAVVSASRHEGFCLPVIEGLRAGCIPLGYAVGAMPETMGGLGRLVEPLSVDALAAGIAGLVEEISRSLARPGLDCLQLQHGWMSAEAFAAAARRYVNAYSSERFRSEVLRRVKAVAVDQRAPSEGT